MSTSKEAKLKTSVGGLLGPLLKQVELALDSADPIIEPTIARIYILLEKVKEHNDYWEKLIIGHLGKIEREIDYWNENKGQKQFRASANEEAKNDATFLSTIKEKLDIQFRDLSENLKKLGIEQPNFSKKLREKASDVPSGRTQLEVGESSNSSNQENDGSVELEQCLNELKPYLKNCLDSLTIFPRNVEIKKRLLVYLWIGLGIVSGGNENKTYEQLGEEYFYELVEKNVLKPVRREHNQVVDRCIINPTIHRQIIASCGKKGTFSNKKVRDGTWHFYEYGPGIGGSKVKALLNLDINYLNSSDINSQMKEPQVLQLGRWRWHNPKSEDNKGSSKEHIEVDETNFLRKMDQSLRYLSLRGISEITKLPESFGKLGDMRILDLRSCHNLEQLPQKPRSILRNMIAQVFPQHQMKWFDKLTYLDISECHLLDSLPKWIGELFNLEVLKGFVVGSMGRKTLAQLRDLSNLKKLRKLSIKVANKHFSPADFSGLEPLDNLLVLIIIWSISDQKDRSTKNISHPKERLKENKESVISFPKNLEKLDIRCYPNAEAPELLNSANLIKLKRLYIRGGNLAKLGDDVVWEGEILRLRFLNKFVFDWLKLSSTFPKLNCVEYEKCRELIHFPRNRSSWITTLDGPFPNLHGLFNDDEEVIISPNSEYLGRPISNRSGRVGLVVEGRIERAVEEGTHDVTLVLSANGGRCGVDLVLVLDISRNMKGHNLGQMKMYLSRLIDKLTPTDRLSIVTFNTIAKRQCELSRVTKSFKREIEDVINSLEAGDSGDTNTFYGLKMGLKVLQDRRFCGKHAIGIVLMSGGPQTIRFGDAAKVPLGNVPVHAFGFGATQDSRVLEAIADNSNGGRYRKEVPLYGIGSTDYKTVHGQTLDSFCEILGTAVKGLTMTITPIEKKAITANDLKKKKESKSAMLEYGHVYNGSFNTISRGTDPRSMIVEVGYIFEGYPVEVYLSVFVPEHCEADLQVRYLYEFRGQKFEQGPETVLSVTGYYPAD